MAQLDRGWLNVFSPRVTEGLSFREDFGWAGRFPRTGAEGRLDALQGVWDALYRGDSLTSGVFGIKKLVFSNFRLSWWNLGTWCLLSAVGGQQGLLGIAPGGPVFSTGLVSLTLSGVFTWTTSGCESLSCVAAAWDPVVLHLSVLLKAGLGPSVFPFCLRSPSALSPFPAGPALPVSWSLQGLLPMLCALQGWSLRKRLRAGGTHFCSAAARHFLQALAFSLFGITVLLFGFRRQLLWFLWVPGPLIEVHALGGYWWKCFNRLGCPRATLSHWAQTPAAAAVATLEGMEAFWSVLTEAVGMFQFARVGWGNRGGSPSWIWRGLEWCIRGKHFSRVAGRWNDFLTCRRQAVLHRDIYQPQSGQAL